MKDTEYLNEFYKHISINSILVVTKEGKLIRLYCPFKVRAKVSFPQIEAGSNAWEDMVQITVDLKDVYMIKGYAYYSIYFTILPDDFGKDDKYSKRL